MALLLELDDLQPVLRAAADEGPTLPAKEARRAQDFLIETALPRPEGGVRPGPVQGRQLRLRPVGALPFQAEGVLFPEKLPHGVLLYWASMRSFRSVR